MKQESKKTFKILLYIFIIVLVVFTIYDKLDFFNSEKSNTKPLLIIDEYYQIDSSENGRINGEVFNNGKIIANNVIINCVIKKKNIIIGLNQQSLGDISVGSSRSFTMSIEFILDRKDYDWTNTISKCVTDCSNC